MRFQKIRVAVNKNYGLGDITEVWIVKTEGDKNYLASIGKDGFIVFKLMREGAEPGPPTMRMHTELVEEMVAAIVKEIPPPEKQAVDAELKATKYHLEDMRKVAQIK